MFTWKRLLYASALIIILLFAFTSLILPGIVIDRAQSWVAAETGRTLKIDSVTINPLGLTVAIHELSLSEADQHTPFITWQKLSLSLSVKSLFHLAPIVDELKLDNPTLHLERLADHQFNFSDLLPETKEEASPDSPKEPSRFSLNNLTINNGSIELIDSSLGEEIKHTIQELNLALPAIGNLAYMVENPVQPMLHAVVNDAPIDIQGTLKPFSKTQEMHFKLALDDIDLPFYLGYVPMELPIQLRTGRLSFDLGLIYRLSAETGPQLELNGDVVLTGLNIFDRQSEQLFFLPLLQCQIAPSQLLEKAIHLATLRIYNLEVQLNRDSKGEWNHARLKMPETAKPQPEEPAAADTKPFNLTIDSLWLRDGVIVFRDDIPPGGFETVVKDITLDLHDFALGSSTPMPLHLALATERDEQLEIEGHLALEPLSLSLAIKAAQIPLAAYQPYYQATVAAPLGGTLHLQTQLAVTPENPLLLSNAQMVINDLYGPIAADEGLWIDLLKVSDFSFDLAANRLEIERIAYDDARVRFSRAHDGRWSFMSRNYPVLMKLLEPRAEQPAKPKTAPSGPEFNYRIGELTLQNWNFDIRDHQLKQPARIRIDDLNLAIQNLAAPEPVQSPITFSALVPPKGQVQIDGNLSLANQSVELVGQLTQLPLTPLAPYLAEQTNLELSNGVINAKLKVKSVPNADGAAIAFAGKLGISRMHLLDGLHHEDLVKWDSLQVAGLKGTTAPLSLAIDSITLSDYFAKVIIDEEARLNLTEAFKNSDESTEDALTKAEKPATEIEPVPVQPTTSPEVQIAKVVLQGGQIDFTDRHLPQPFHADMQKLGGRIEGLSSAPDARAEVDLRGNLRNQSPLSITGEINPLAKELFLDLKLGFRDIEMSPFSPYSGTFVGYLIEKGKLHLNLNYFIEESRLKASNKVFIDQLTFGEAVESEQATSLPVKLAVALLKDRNGEIHLDIPVSGSLNDPQFSIGSVIWTVLKNLLVKAATSPFALLGALVGGGDEDFSSISFDYGSSRLTELEQDKLRLMAKALLDRPSLDIEIKGYIDAEKDPEGYRRELLNQQLNQLKYQELVEEEKLPEGATAHSLVLEPEEYTEYLWQVYKETSFPKPRNFIGMTKQLSDTEMEKLIYANTTVSTEELAKLAQARALSVQNFLVEAGQLPGERVFLTKPKITEAPEEEGKIKARVELGVTVQ